MRLHHHHHHHQLQLQQQHSDVIRCGDFPLRPSSLLRFSLFDIKLRPQRVRRLSQVAPPKKKIAFVCLLMRSVPHQAHFLRGRRLPLHSSVIFSAASLPRPPRPTILLTDALILPSSAAEKTLQHLESV